VTAWEKRLGSDCDGDAIIIAHDMTESPRRKSKEEEPGQQDPPGGDRPRCSNGRGGLGPGRPGPDRYVVTP
jgi:hypothetical protein